MATRITALPPNAVCVVGAGPTGTALAIELARLGCAVALVDPATELRFPNSYGGFLRHLAPLSLETVAHALPRTPRFVFQDGSERVLDEKYVRIDSARLAGEFESLLAKFDVKRVAARTTRIERSTTGFVVSLDDGRILEPKLVIDTRGKESFPASTRALAFQSALGFWVRCERPLDEPLDVTLMDFRASSQGTPGSFLYRVPRDDGELLFVQETFLATRKVADFRLLESALLARLEDAKLGKFEIVRREHCVIPLGLPVPRQAEWPRFGAAASYTQPASGYQLTRALLAAPRVARRVAETLDAPVERLVARTLDAVWTKDERTARRYLDFGLEVLLRLEPSTQENFLRVFSNLGDSLVASYMEGLLDSSAVRKLMWNQFVACPPKLKSALAVAGVRAFGETLSLSLYPFPRSSGEPA